jgi:glutamyl-tRNA synthetase
MGIVPEAFRNFLALLGWSPGEQAKQADGSEREIFSTEELIQMFSLSGIARSNAVFSNEKLAWFNTEYIRSYPPQSLLPLVQEEWRRVGFEANRSREEVMEGMALLQQRARSLKDFAITFQAYFSDQFPIDPAAENKFLPDAKVREMLAELGQRYANQESFTEASAERDLRAFAAEQRIKAGALINGARVALTGQAVAPSLFAVMSYLGRDRVVKRLIAAEGLAPTDGAATPA